MPCPALPLRFLATLAFALVGAPVAGAEPPSAASSGVDAAERDFQEGTARFAQKSYEDALAAFRRSLEASGSPNARLMVGRTLRELGRLAEAVGEFEAAAIDAGVRARTESAYAQTRDAAQAELARLADKVARVRLAVAPSGARVRLNGRELSADEAGKSVAVMPGHTVLEVDAPGHRADRREWTAVAGRETFERVSLVAEGAGEAAPTPPKGRASDGDSHTSGISTLGWLGWGGVGLGLAAGGAFTLFYVLADGTHEDLAAACADGTCSAAKRKDLVDQGETYEILTNVSLGVGVAALAMGVGLLLWDATEGPAPDVQVTADGASISLRSAF